MIKPWEFRVGEYTDRTSEQLVIDNVRAVLLDYLPQEIPYNLTVEMEYFDKKKGNKHVTEDESVVRLVHRSAPFRLYSPLCRSYFRKR